MISMTPTSSFIELNDKNMPKARKIQLPFDQDTRDEEEDSSAPPENYEINNNNNNQSAGEKTMEDLKIHQFFKHGHVHLRRCWVRRKGWKWGRQGYQSHRYLLSTATTPGALL